MNPFLELYGFIYAVCQHCLSFGPCSPLRCLAVEPQLVPLDEPIPESVPYATFTIHLCPRCAAHPSADGSVVVV